MLNAQRSPTLDVYAHMSSHRTTYSFFTASQNWILVVILILVAAILAAGDLNGAYWVDEVITVERAGAPSHGGPFSPLEIWQHTAETTYDQVPGYFIAVAAWNNTLGWSEFATRLFSLMAGLLAVAWVYRLGRDLHSPLAGLAAAAALVASAYYIDFLHEGRTYALVILVSAFTIWLYWRVIRRRTGWLAQAALVICTAGLLYLHYFAVLLVFTICAYHLLFVPKNREWWRVVILMGLAGALFLPWLVTSFEVVQGVNGDEWRQGQSLSVPEVVEQILGFFANGSVALLIIAGVLALPSRRLAERYTWVMLAGPLALALIINAWLGMLITPKYLLYLWVPLALIFGAGVTRLTARGIHPALILVPWLTVGIWTSANWEDDPVKYIAWDVLHDQLATQIQEDDAIVYHLTAELWDGVHERGLQHYFHDFPSIPHLLWSWPHAPDQVYLQDLPNIIAGRQRLWSSYDPRHEPARISQYEAIVTENGFANCGSAASHPYMQVDLYVRQPDELPFHFGGDLYQNGIRMTRLGPVAEDHTGRLRIPLGWRLGKDVPVNTYSFAIHVLDRNGTLVAQTDTGLPPDYAFGCQAVAVETNGLPAGEYQLSLVVYAWETGQRLNARNPAGLSAGDRINLGTFTKSP